MALLMSRNTESVGLPTLKVMTRPALSTTNQRLLSPGAWTAATAFDGPTSKTSVMVIVDEPTVRAGATQRKLHGRTSSPQVIPAGVVTLLVLEYPLVFAAASTARTR